MKRIFMATLSVAILLYGMTAAARTPEGDTLGAGLSRLTERLEAVVGKGCGSASVTVIEAGIRVATLVENVKIAHDDSLDRLDAAQAKVLEEIATIVATLEAGTDADMAGKIAAVEASFAFKENIPRVSSVSPRFVASSLKPYTVSLAVSGVFPLATDADARPYLLVKGKKYSPSEASVQKLFFAIPVRELFAPPLSGFGYSRIQLMVPYKAGVFSRKDGAFSLLVAGFPGGPGKVIIKHRETSPVTEKRHIVTRQWSQSSAKKTLEATFCGEKHDGWKIGPETIRFVTDTASGDETDDWFQTLFTSEPRVCFHVRTIHNRHGVNGEVTFHFEYDIERTTDVETWQEEGVALNWGDSRTFQYPGNGWRVILDSFDGKHYEYDRTTTDNPLLRVVAGDDFVTISAPPAQKVTWPQ